MKRLLAAIALLLLAGVTNAATEPDPAPLFGATVVDLEDHPVPLSTLKGKPLIINFWARWCSPCRTEIPELSRIQRRNPRITVVGIALEDKVEPVKEFARAYEIRYPVYLARDLGIDLLKAMGDDQAALPYTLAIDRAGRVVFHKLGPLTPADIKAALGRIR